MRTNRLLLFALAGPLLACGLPAPAHGHSVSDGASSGGYTSTVIANITAPAQNAVFHTGGPSGSMMIDYSADNTAKVVSDGTNSEAATFGFIIELLLSPSTSLDLEAGGPITIQPFVSGNIPESCWAGGSPAR